MLGDDILARHQHDPACIGAQRHMLSGEPGGHTVAIAGILNQAGGADADGLFHVSVKCPPQRAQCGAFVFEYLSNRAIVLFGMGPIGQFLATQAQPVVQRIEIIKGRFGRKQPAAQKLDLVLDLPLLPTRCGRAGNRFHDVMVHQGQEPGMEYPVLRAGDMGHHRFGVVDDHPAWNPVIE